MKYFHLLATFVVAASAAQAATVTWSSGDLDNITDGITDVKGYYYAISDSTYNEIANLSSADLYDHFQGASSSQYASDVEYSYGPLSASWRNEISQDIDEQYNVVAIYTGTQNGEEVYIAYAASKYTSNADPDTDLPDPDAEAKVSSLATFAYNKSGGNWTAVPEPTTVALLALGLAAVGLKRKVA